MHIHNLFAKCVHVSFFFCQSQKTKKKKKCDGACDLCAPQLIEVKGYFSITLPSRAMLSSSTALLNLISNRLDQLHFFETGVTAEMFIEAHKLNVSIWRLYREVVVAFDCDIHMQTFRSKVLEPFTPRFDLRKVLLTGFVPLGVAAIYIGWQALADDRRSRQAVLRLCSEDEDLNDWTLFSKQHDASARQLCVRPKSDYTKIIVQFIEEIASLLNVEMIQISVDAKQKLTWDEMKEKGYNDISSIFGPPAFAKFLKQVKHTQDSYDQPIPWPIGWAQK